MDRRRDTRFPANQEVAVTLLGSEEVRFKATALNLSGRGLRLLLDRPVPLDSALRVDWNDSMLLGEVCYCLQEGDRFAVGLQLEQALCDVTELGRLHENAFAQLYEQAPEPQAVRANLRREPKT